MRKITVCYPEGKMKALTMSYDDGGAADKRLIDIFNRYGIKGTFHLNSGLIGQGNRVREDEVAQVYKGHEVAAHSVTHPIIAMSPKEQIVNEILEDRKTLERLVGYTVRGLSYPFGSYNSMIKQMLPHLGIDYARVVGNSGTFSLPDDWYEWKATCHHNANLMDYAELFVSKKQGLLYVWGHSHEFDKDQNWQLIEDFCAFIGGRDDIWYVTNIEFVDYMKAFRNLQCSAACDFVYNPSARSVWLMVDGEPVEIKGGAQVRLD